MKCTLYCYFLSLACVLKCNQINHKQDAFARLYSYQIEYDDGIFLLFLSYIESKALADLFFSFTIPVYEKLVDDKSFYLLETNESQLDDKKWQSITINSGVPLMRDDVTFVDYPSLLYMHIQERSCQHPSTFSIMGCQVIESLVLENKCCNNIKEFTITSMMNIRILNKSIFLH